MRYAHEPGSTGTRSARSSFQRVLVPIGAAGPLQNAALAAALGAAAPDDGQIRLLHIRPWQLPLIPSREDGAPLPAMELLAETPEHAAELMDETLRDLQMRGVRADGIVMEARGPKIAPMIANAAANWHADLIVVGGPSRRHLVPLHGRSVCEDLLRSAPCPVLVVEPTPA